ncbi:hypothetical protein Enr13x_20570 [Stieleria neptunia]|uniref:Uncharacterized protein n=1 Tax=Stieleria neptunia TaxID=2527979 RepID=A0A518HMY1_9BACT|nr:hypothetical protein Enr13x_20570 [Stieleria neptunia]
MHVRIVEVSTASDSDYEPISRRGKLLPTIYLNLFDMPLYNAY